MASWLLSKPISPKGIKGLSEYKYRGVDHSLIYKLMLPMLNTLVTYFPLWVAPNLITLTGLLFMSAAYILLCGFISPDMQTVAPVWVYVFCAVAKFFYQVLDELDGKQARRTGSSSPLGELFDHGCDALSCMLTTTTIAAAMGLGSGWWFWALNTAVFGAFYSTIWEQLHTNFLELHYLGPNEAHAAYILLMLATAVLGPAFWTRPTPFLPFVLSLKHAAVSALLCSALLDFLINLKRVAPYLCSFAAFARGLYLLLPFPLVATLSYMWVTQVPQLLHHHPQALALGFGFLNSHQVGTLIISRVTTDPPRPYVLSLAVLLFCVLQNFSPAGPLLQPHAQIWLFAAAAALNWAHFAFSTIFQLCDILKVRVLHIPVRKAPVPTPGH